MKRDVTRVEVMLEAARAMFASNFSQDTEPVTEDEMWRDADEETREEYIRLAVAASKRVLRSLPAFIDLPAGGCCCRDELHRPPTVAILQGVNTTGLCETCNGRA